MTVDTEDRETVWLPLFWNLRSRRVVVVGGGETAAGKIPLLLEAEASVVVVSPKLTGSVASHVEAGEVEWLDRRFETGDLDGATFAIAATDDPIVNQRVFDEAERLAIPINAVDDPERCTVIFSAVHRDGPLVVAVSTTGAAPALATRLRDRIAEMTAGYGDRLRMLRTFRPQVRSRFDTFDRRRDVWYRIVDSLADGRFEREVDEAELVQAVIDEHAVSLVSPHRVRGASERITRALEHAVAPVTTCSMQLGGLVLLHQLRRLAPDIPVVFVDTGYLFPETLEFRDRLVEEWNLNLRVVAADVTVGAHEAARGSLFRSDPAACCAARKVGPAETALEGHDVWFAAVRRSQGGSRIDLPEEVEHRTSLGHAIRKVHPLVDWSWADVDRYAAAHDIPRHPLYEMGFTSIGCAPCTTPTFGAGGERAGRWDGTEITECGLHVRSGEEESA